MVSTSLAIFSACFKSSWTKYLVSQFTLLAKTKKGTKPDFHGAANPEEASRLYHYFVQKVKDMYQVDRVKDGRFQAMMEVALVNDGPVSHCWARASLSSLMLILIGYVGAPSRRAGV